MDRKFITALIILVLFFTSFYLFPYLKKQESMELDEQNNRPESFQAKYYYPMADYNERLNFRWFGKNISASDTTSPCGSAFAGFHTADDLEVFPNEKEKSIPVFAISDAEVIENGFVSGYGGLLVLLTVIEGQEYTLYYGHVDLTKKANIIAGESFKAGEKIVDLSRGCTDESGGERKHLHFGIRRGEKIDVRGYVFNSSELGEWENPKLFLEKIKAIEPNINAYGNKNFVRFPININIYLLYIYKVLTGR